jgi:hypothetical protein
MYERLQCLSSMNHHNGRNDTADTNMFN